jgi:uncharacterized protein YuzB (UPF0349 family)
MIKKFTLAAIALTLIASFYSGNADAQQVIRGPYLQSQGPNSIIVRWRTDSLTDSRVTIGSTLGATTTHFDTATLTTEHRVLVKNLQPKTKYYYQVGSSTQVLRGPDTRMYFTTATDLTTDPVKFWVIGDFGHGNTAERLVRDSYYNFVEPNNPVDFQMWVGDNAYSDGTELEYTNKVFDTVNAYGSVFLNLPFVPTSGNHDWNSICNWQAPCNTDPNVQTGPYLNIIDPPTEGEFGGVPSHKKLFYSFDRGDIHFVCLNSELGSGITQAYNWIGLNNFDTAFTSPMLEWLKQDLAATTKKWKIAFWHQMPYSGQNDLTELSSFQLFCIAMRTHANPILERYGVDLVLCGHDHNYQRSYLINNHYGYKADFDPSMMINGTSGNDAVNEAYIKYTNGPVAGKGTVYVVQGNSSEGNDISPISHPAIYWGEACDTCYGSTFIEVNGDRLDGRYMTSNGVVRDQYTIKKQAWTGIDEEDAAFDHFYVYPNPFAERTRIGYQVLKRCPVKIDVLDVTGRVVYPYYSGEKEPGSYKDIIDMDRDELPDGNYIIRLDCGGVVKYRKVVKM